MALVAQAHPRGDDRARSTRTTSRSRARAGSPTRRVLVTLRAPQRARSRSSPPAALILALPADRRGARRGDVRAAGPRLAARRRRSTTRTCRWCRALALVVAAVIIARQPRRPTSLYIVRRSADPAREGRPRERRSRPPRRGALVAGATAPRRRFPVADRRCASSSSRSSSLCAVFGSLHRARTTPTRRICSSASQRPSGDHLLGTDDSAATSSRASSSARARPWSGRSLIALGAMLHRQRARAARRLPRRRRRLVIMRWVDLMYALPGLLVAIVVVGVARRRLLARGRRCSSCSRRRYDTRIDPRRDARAARAARTSRRRATLGLSPRRIMFAPHLAEHAAARRRQHVPQLRVQPRRALGALVPRARRRPGHADWGRMLAENRDAALRQPGRGARARRSCSCSRRRA